jgi:hypothetical protein
MVPNDKRAVVDVALNAAAGAGYWVRRFGNVGGLRRHVVLGAGVRGA